MGAQQMWAPVGRFLRRRAVFVVAVLAPLITLWITSTGDGQLDRELLVRAIWCVDCPQTFGPGTHIDIMGPSEAEQARLARYVDCSAGRVRSSEAVPQDDRSYIEHQVDAYAGWWAHGFDIYHVRRVAEMNSALTLRAALLCKRLRLCEGMPGFVSMPAGVDSWGRSKNYTSWSAHPLVRRFGLELSCLLASGKQRP